MGSQRPNMNTFSLIIFTCLIIGASSFSMNAASRFYWTNSHAVNQNTRCLAKRIDDNYDDCFRTIESQKSRSSTQHFTRRYVVSLVTMAALSLEISSPARAELGRETELQTDLTGESVMICTKRGPLGACLNTEKRTEDNENDKSYLSFRRATDLVKRKDDEAEETTEGLIGRLKKQSEENFEKNELIVKQRTQINDAPANFGPFDSQVLILNEDGKGFSLLKNPQAMRLKKLGLIENKKFLRQPTQEELNVALEPPNSSESNIFNRILGIFSR
mmetsp:Transcript_59565/g.66668  ORF Transcript_59565/g.66668 Transcript_59565/m.66668 type:complete len:274 (-) Transcript_59565:83-904(-)